MSFRYIEMSTSSSSSSPSNKTESSIFTSRHRRRRSDVIITQENIRDMFLGQAILAFVENGLHTTLLPHALSSYPNSERNISIATKLAYAGSSLSIIAAHYKPLRSRAEWITSYTFVFATSLWMIISSAGAYSNYNNVFPYEQGAVTIIVICKITVAYTKTALFLAYFRVKNKGDLDDDMEASLLEVGIEENEENILLSSQQQYGEDDIFRLGGVGIQVGGFVGAILFFVLTVPTSILNG